MVIDASGVLVLSASKSDNVSDTSHRMNRMAGHCD